jgi:hypothetical protein
MIRPEARFFDGDGSLHEETIRAEDVLEAGLGHLELLREVLDDSQRVIPEVDGFDRVVDPVAPGAISEGFALELLHAGVSRVNDVLGVFSAGEVDERYASRLQNLADGLIGSIFRGAVIAVVDTQVGDGRFSDSGWRTREIRTTGLNAIGGYEVVGKVCLDSGPNKPDINQRYGALFADILVANRRIHDRGI